MVRAAFLISITGHCLLLGAPGFNSGLPRQKAQPKELAVELEIEKPALLPKIDAIGREKKIKEVEQKPKQPELELKPQSLPEETIVQPAPQEHVEEIIDVRHPDKTAMLRYQDIVKQRIEDARRYPLWARKQGIEGITRLYFTVLPQGLARDIRMVHSSGSSILDQEAVATVQRAGPFPPIPKEIGSSSVGMEVAIVFSLHKE